MIMLNCGTPKRASPQDPCQSIRRFVPPSAVKHVSILLAIALTPLLAPNLQANPPQIPAPAHADYRIAIHCSRKVLQLWHQTRLIREYPIEVGKGGLAKKRSGDHRTPIGDYAISWMASRHSSKGFRIKDKRSWCKANAFADAATGPSLEKLWTDSYGGEQAAVMSINYPNSRDRKLGRTGDCIHIHADKHLVNGRLKKSFGCIHMFPKDARELYDLVHEGTPVKILP